MKLTPSSTPTPIKMLLLGFSGMGKSASLASLGTPNIIPGWPGRRVRIINFDGKGKAEEIIRAQLAYFLSSKRITEPDYKAAFDNFDITDSLESIGVVDMGSRSKEGKILGIVGSPMAFRSAINQLDAWARDWKPEDILVIDSLTYAAEAITNWTQGMNGKLNKELEWRDYGAPQRRIIDMITQLAALPCSTILTGHQAPLDIYQKTGETKTKDDGSKEEVQELVESSMAPIAIGKANRIMIPSQFNHTLVVGFTASKERRIFTKPQDGVMTKTPFFARADDSYKIEDGLARYFSLAI